MAVGKYLDGKIPNMTQETVTIASSGTTSTALDMRGRGIVAVILPAAFTGATITFQMSPTGTGGTFYDCYNAADSQMSMTVTQGRCYLLDPADLVGVRYIKLVSGSAEGAERTITLILRELQ